MQVDPRYPTDRLHDNLKIDWLDVARQKATCIEAFKIINGLAPRNLNNIVRQVNPVRHTRSGNTVMLDCPKTRTKLGDMNFKICAYRYWKGLPADLRSVDSLDTFRTNIKQYEGLMHVR